MFLLLCMPLCAEEKSVFGQPTKDNPVHVVSEAGVVEVVEPVHSGNLRLGSLNQILGSTMLFPVL